MTQLKALLLCTSAQADLVEMRLVIGEFGSAKDEYFVSSVELFRPPRAT